MNECWVVLLDMSNSYSFIIFPLLFIPCDAWKLWSWVSYNDILSPLLYINTHSIIYSLLVCWDICFHLSASFINWWNTITAIYTTQQTTAVPFIFIDLTIGQFHLGQLIILQAVCMEAPLGFLNTSYKQKLLLHWSRSCCVMVQSEIHTKSLRVWSCLAIGFLLLCFGWHAFISPAREAWPIYPGPIIIEALVSEVMDRALF